MTLYKKLKRAYMLCPIRHTLLFISAAAIIIHLLLRKSALAMQFISNKIVQPINQFSTIITSIVSFSVAELLIACLVIGFALYAIYCFVIAIRGRCAVKMLYKYVVTAMLAITTIYAGFCALWGCYFYDRSFAEKSGLSEEPISVEQLETVTAYFASLANFYSYQVERDSNGLYTVERQAILDKSPHVYERIEKLFPCLEANEVKVKGIYFSKIMSLIDFTGFYFPLTGEANVNMDFPPSLFPSTVAHEISHQRGVCKEQEANFLAVLSCLEYGDIDYCYSACLLAYTHLGNALYTANYDAWERIYLSLDEAILRDFAVNRAYWAQFETPVQKVSNTVYENFMYSYDQHLGLKSYGACVDLLVNYYYEKAVDQK